MCQSHCPATMLCAGLAGWEDVCCVSVSLSGDHALCGSSRLGGCVLCVSLTVRRPCFVNLSVCCVCTMCVCVCAIDVYVCINGVVHNEHVACVFLLC